MCSCDMGLRVQLWAGAACAAVAGAAGAVVQPGCKIAASRNLQLQLWKGLACRRTAASCMKVQSWHNCMSYSCIFNTPTPNTPQGEPVDKGSKDLTCAGVALWS